MGYDLIISFNVNKKLINNFWLDSITQSPQRDRKDRTHKGKGRKKDKKKKGNGKLELSFIIYTLYNLLFNTYNVF